jgi:formylmethanofuran dehydrogenase subunit C
MPLRLKWLSVTTLPVDGSALRPDLFRDRSADRARGIPLHVGNSTAELADLFHVEGTQGDERLIVEGNLSHVHGLGRGMSGGHLCVHGDAGPQLGAEMSGGLIEVDGSSGDWAGAEMRGGMIKIRGDTGSFLGAAYPGSRVGMRDGVILVEGSAGDDAGVQMQRGIIAIRGGVGGGLARSMIAGTVVVLGPVRKRIGAGMKRGSLVLPALGNSPEDCLLPTFTLAGQFPLPFLTVYLKQLSARGFAVPAAVLSARLDRYNGDSVVGGRGEILAGRTLS